jgi:hypothetical protein
MDLQYSMLPIRADVKRRTCRLLEPNIPIQMSGYMQWLKNELIAAHGDGGKLLLQALEVQNEGYTLNLMHLLEQALGIVQMVGMGPGLGAPCA